MATQPHRTDCPHRSAIWIVAFLGLYQGAVPLAVRAMFGRDQRLAPALWLPAPWWWLSCIAIVAVAVTIIGVIEFARQRRFPNDRSSDGGNVTAAALTATSQPPSSQQSAIYDSLSAVVLLVGIYNGLAPLIARLVFDGNLLLALPLRLEAPWWWITSLAVIAATVVLLTLIEAAKHASR